MKIEQAKKCAEIESYYRLANKLLRGRGVPKRVTVDDCFQYGLAKEELMYYVIDINDNYKVSTFTKRSDVTLSTGIDNANLQKLLKNQRWSVNDKYVFRLERDGEWRTVEYIESQILS